MKTPFDAPETFRRLMADELDITWARPLLTHEQQLTLRQRLLAELRACPEFEKHSPAEQDELTERTLQRFVEWLDRDEWPYHVVRALQARQVKGWVWVQDLADIVTAYLRECWPEWGQPFEVSKSPLGKVLGDLGLPSKEIDGKTHYGCTAVPFIDPDAYGKPRLPPC